jgi:small subunit ribosomal protein S21
MRLFFSDFRGKSRHLIGLRPYSSAKRPPQCFFGLKMSRLCFRVIVRKNFDEIVRGIVVLWLLLAPEAREGIFCMLKVKSRAGESVQQMIRRFKKLCEKEGLIRDMKRNAYYEKPSEKNRRRMRKAARNVERY